MIKLKPVLQSIHFQPRNPLQFPASGSASAPGRRRETHLLKDRLLYLLQPPLDGLFDGRQLEVPHQPFPYQLEGIAFLLPRSSALLADEMGLGKTAQAILALRLALPSGIDPTRSLLVCPKPLVPNWGRELKMWAPDIPFEVISGESAERRRTWLVSNCPLKLINYETLCRDAEVLAETPFDVVVLDEAQRIKNKGSRTAEVVSSIRRERSWALTGTPIENHHDDLANIFHFIDPGRIPPDCPQNLLTSLIGDSILRRTKDIVQSDMPPKMIVDVELELTAAQRAAYERAEKDGVVHLNELGDTLTVQHVFQLVMRLKQICNFDPLTGESAKMERLIADMDEVAESGRKAIIFSQWVEPLEVLAEALAPFGPLQFHGRIPQSQRTAILDRFKEDDDAHVIFDDLRHRQRRPESAIHELRVSLRPLVESRRGGPGDQPRPPHRPEASRDREAFYERGDDRTENRGCLRSKAEALQRHPQPGGQAEFARFERRRDLRALRHSTLAGRASDGARSLTCPVACASG